MSQNEDNILGVVKEVKFKLIRVVAPGEPKGNPVGEIVCQDGCVVFVPSDQMLHSEYLALEKPLAALLKPKARGVKRKSDQAT